MLKLYAVLLGGRAVNCNTELHDVVFVVGKSLEGTYTQLLTKWFGIRERLHIDSYVELNAIDGFEIDISEQQSESASQSLYFVNIGGYKQDFFGEIHEMGFFIGSSKEEVAARAKLKLGISLLHQHCDDNLNILEVMDDDVIKLEKVDGYYISLRKVNQELAPLKIISEYHKLDAAAI